MLWEHPWGVTHCLKPMEQHQFIGCYTSSVPHKETHLQHQFQMFMKEVVWKEQEITKLFFFSPQGTNVTLVLLMLHQYGNYTTVQC